MNVYPLSYFQKASYHARSEKGRFLYHHLGSPSRMKFDWIYSCYSAGCSRHLQDWPPEVWCIQMCTFMNLYQHLGGGPVWTCFLECLVSWRQKRYRLDVAQVWWLTYEPPSQLFGAGFCILQSTDSLLRPHHYHHPGASLCSIGSYHLKAAHPQNCALRDREIPPFKQMGHFPARYAANQ